MTITLNAKLVMIRRKPVIVYPLHRRENVSHTREIEDMILLWCKNNIKKLKSHGEYHMSALWNPNEKKILKVSLYDTEGNWNVLAGGDIKQVSPVEIVSCL